MSARRTIALLLAAQRRLRIDADCTRGRAADLLLDQADELEDVLTGVRAAYRAVKEAEEGPQWAVAGDWGSLMQRAA